MRVEAKGVTKVRVRCRITDVSVINLLWSIPWGSVSASKGCIRLLIYEYWLAVLRAFVPRANLLLLLSVMLPQ